MKIIITGAAGHLGSNLLPLLQRENWNVTALDMAPRPAALPEGCHYIQAGLDDAAILQETLAGVDLVVHCAAIHPWKEYSDDQYLDANVKGTWNFYSAAAAVGVKNVVLTSSIAAVGYNIPAEEWPVSEDRCFQLTDLYSFTKHAQEDIARLFADMHGIRTFALRPPAFMPKPELETGFGLLGSFARVDDIARAHVAAARVLLGQQNAPEFKAFEAFYVTNALPYQPEDAAVFQREGIRPLIHKYWPLAADRLPAGNEGATWLSGVYDLAKAKSILGWEPQFNFEQWFRAFDAKSRNA